jgi:hypothetical protein
MEREINMSKHRLGDEAWDPFDDEETQRSAAIKELKKMIFDTYNKVVSQNLTYNFFKSEFIRISDIGIEAKLPKYVIGNIGAYFEALNDEIRSNRVEFVRNCKDEDDGSNGDCWIRSGKIYR